MLFNHLFCILHASVRKLKDNHGQRIFDSHPKALSSVPKALCNIYSLVLSQRNLTTVDHALPFLPPLGLGTSALRHLSVSISADSPLTLLGGCIFLCSFIMISFLDQVFNFLVKSTWREPVPHSGYDVSYVFRSLFSSLKHLPDLLR